jgi:hypothetical protein
MIIDLIYSQIMQKIFPRPWREGIEGRGYLLTITLSPTLSRSGRGGFLFFIS